MMRNIGWGTVAGLGLAGLLAAARPATAQSGTSSDRMGSGSTSTTTTTDRSTTTTTDSSKDTGSATGSSTGTMGSGSTAMKDTSQELTGTVEKFDHASKELTLANSSKKLKISDDTTVMKDGQAATLTDIQEGDQVRASFSGSGDTLQVSRIEVMSAGSTGSGMHDTTSPSTGSSSTGSSTTTPDTSRSTGTGADTGPTTGGGTSGKRY